MLQLKATPSSAICGHSVCADSEWTIGVIIEEISTAAATLDMKPEKMSPISSSTNRTREGLRTAVRIRE